MHACPLEDILPRRVTSVVFPAFVLVQRPEPILYFLRLRPVRIVEHDPNGLVSLQTD